MKKLQKENNTKKTETLKEKENERNKAHKNKEHNGKDLEKKTESENLLEYQGTNITAKDKKH